MNAVVADEIKTTILTSILGVSPFASGLTMLLFTGGGGIDHTDTYATLTAREVAFTGYAQQNIASWTSPVLTPDFHARSQGSTLTYTNSGGSASPTITGWAIVDVGGAKLVQAGLYDTPFVIAGGDSYLTTPFITYTGEIASEP